MVIAPLTVFDIVLFLGVIAAGQSVGNLNSKAKALADFVNVFQAEFTPVVI